MAAMMIRITLVRETSVLEALIAIAMPVSELTFPFPFPHSDVREWSLFACRNICDRNEENQNVIANIKVSGVMPSVELEQMGFRAVLENTGKVRVEKVEEGDADHTLLAQKPEEQ